MMRAAGDETGVGAAPSIHEYAALRPSPRVVRGGVVTPSSVATEGGIRRSTAPPARRSPRVGAWSGTKVVLVLSDVATVAVSITLATVVAAVAGDWTVAELRHEMVMAVATLPVWPLLFARQRLYAARFVTRLFDEIRRALGAVLMGSVTIVLMGWALQFEVPRLWLAFVTVFSMVGISAERIAARALFRRRRRSGRMLRRVVIVGTNDEAQDIERSLRDPILGYEVVGFVSEGPDAPAEIDGIPVRTEARNTVEVAHALGAYGVIMATTSLEVGLSNQLLRQLLDDGLHVELTSGLRDVTPERMVVRPLGRHPVVYLEPARRFGWRAVAKRTFDVVVSSALLVLSAPVLVLAAVAIKVTSRGPVLFRQMRVGRGGSEFELVKLRTMVVGAEAMLDELLAHNDVDGPLFKLHDDPRVTRVGRWLRKLSVDELPQLWNVLRGDMSLVGPRPALPREVASWDDELHERLRVRPGITGMWQVSGRSGSSFEEYQRLDLFYVDNWSMLIDLAIMVRTVPTVLSARGAH
jgi:exopolysaccharide biosynthesis polyprenyl glycosylphosphotransferase